MNPYEVLEIKSNASKYEINKKRKVLIKIHHPDRFTPGTDEYVYAENKIKEINNAYDLLMQADPVEDISKTAQAEDIPKTDHPYNANTESDQTATSDEYQAKAEADYKTYTKEDTTKSVILTSIATVVYAVLYLYFLYNLLILSTIDISFWGAVLIINLMAIGYSSLIGINKTFASDKRTVFGSLQIGVIILSAIVYSIMGMVSEDFGIIESIFAIIFAVITFIIPTIVSIRVYRSLND